MNENIGKNSIALLSLFLYFHYLLEVYSSSPSFCNLEIIYYIFRYMCANIVILLITGNSVFNFIYDLKQNF